MTQLLPKYTDGTLPLSFKAANGDPLIFAEVDNIIITFFRKGDRKRLAVAKLTGAAGQEIPITPVPDNDSKATIAWKKEFTQDCAENEKIDMQMTLIVGGQSIARPPIEVFVLCANENIDMV